MGARGLDPPRIRWEPYNLMGHSKTNPAGVWLAQFDERAPDSSVWTINGVTPDTVIIDMGQVRDITHFTQLPVTHLSPQNLRGHGSPAIARPARGRR